MVGGGPSLERLRRLAEDLDVASRVRFTGPLPWQQVVGWMKAAHVFVFASRTETQGLVVVEAMACGLPVVAVRAGGVAEVVEHGRTGLLVDPDPEQLGAAAARVLADGHLRRSLGEQARRRAEGFSAPRVAAQLVELYRSVLAGR
jgi:glycosyltransferase involved in cell wall biosynthesis